MRKAMLVLAMLAVCTGCLEKDVTQTVYFEADGSVTWEVLEWDVYSSSEAAEDREREEAEYLASAIAGRPSIVEALEAMGGIDIRSQLVRDRRPYSLRATAHFADPGSALGRLFQAAEIEAEARFEIDGERRILTITPTDLEPRVEEESPLLDLLCADDMRFVLTAGTFEDAEGFSIEGGGRVAVLSDEAAQEGKELSRYRLVWSVPEDR